MAKKFFFFSENRAVCERMRENVVARNRPHCIAFGIPKATNIHSVYVILIAFPLHQWLYERISVFRCTYIVLFRRYGQMFANSVLSPLWWSRLLFRKSNGTLSTECSFVLYIEKWLDREFTVTATSTQCKPNPYHGRETGKLGRYSDSLRVGR